MSSAFGDIRTLPASNKAKTFMKQLVAKGLFDEQRDVWTLGAALGIALGKIHEQGKRGTFQNVNSLDPDGIFSSIILGQYPNASPKERAKKIVDHAEWGIREIARREKNGTLDFVKLAENAFTEKIEINEKLAKRKKGQVDLEDLISEGESDKLEFKASIIWDYVEGKRNKIMGLEIAKTVSAFMNSEGGNLLIGVGDDKIILGLEKDLRLLKKPDTDAFGLHFTNIINNYLGKENRPYVKIRFETKKGKKIAVVTVPNRAPKPVFICSTKETADFYIRLGNASHRLNTRQANEYIKQHW